MKTIQKFAAAALATTMATSAMAKDEVNVAFFLEWATPNQVAKVEKAYDETMGVKINWTDFATGTAMTEAMLSGDIDIAYSQGLAPFVTAVNASAPIKMVGIAVEYGANGCFVKDGVDISKDNASELEGKKVAVPFNTMADYSFREQMRHLGVDVSKIQVVDQEPADAVVALADGNVVMACVFGGNAEKGAEDAGARLMTLAEQQAAGIVSFDVVSATEKFAQENPDLLRSFMKVTDVANAEFAKSQAKIDVIAKDAGMSVENTKKQMNGFTFPTNKEQMETYFNEGGKVEKAVSFVGNAFATAEKPALEDYSVTVDTSFLE